MIDEDDFWSNWWNKNWQGKPKYSEKTCPSATLSTTKSHMTRPGLEPRTAAVGSQRLTAWAMAWPNSGIGHQKFDLLSKGVYCKCYNTKSSKKIDKFDSHSVISAGDNQLGNTHKALTTTVRSNCLCIKNFLYRIRSCVRYIFQVQTVSSEF
jgi:hypothetical protein